MTPPADWLQSMNRWKIPFVRAVKLVGSTMATALSTPSLDFSFPSCGSYCPRRPIPRLLFRRHCRGSPAPPHVSWKVSARVHSHRAGGTADAHRLTAFDTRGSGCRAGGIRSDDSGAGMRSSGLGLVQPGAE